LGAKYIGEQYYKETVNRGTPTESTKDSTTKAYTTIDWNINYEHSNKVTLYAGINNLSDQKVEDVLGSSSGRYFFTGVKVSF
jgi:outer membrane receptor for ferrienterochelin and colicins